MQEAYLIYKLYKKLGPCMVSKLQGDFAFVLHDSHVVRTRPACFDLARWDSLSGTWSR